ncbi:hypothetical protein NX801_04465 [Streptomyces sp. LP05-1]|uniref:Uncharacterized protein n=1 Tax=Streptomyces pyxinae TaxID=2970734 RepID=A0ABT2CC07_9ACTN|nr:hypothetical protein [Streptomyces sp. LP05-1]MCS0634925.1 hypothetical protein [Streptomyces sp. LP05-1]
MTSDTPVIVHPPSEIGGRSVQAGEDSLGTAHSVADVVDLLSGVGLELSPDEVATTRLIDWRGGGPGVWAESPA